MDRSNLYFILYILVIEGLINTRKSIVNLKRFEKRNQGNKSGKSTKGWDSSYLSNRVYSGHKVKDEQVEVISITLVSAMFT